jgi:hypothetical protein
MRWPCKMRSTLPAGALANSLEYIDGARGVERVVVLNEMQATLTGPCFLVPAMIVLGDLPGGQPRG